MLNAVSPPSKSSNLGVVLGTLDTGAKTEVRHKPCSTWPRGWACVTCSSSRRRPLWLEQRSEQERRRRCNSEEREGLDWGGPCCHCQHFGFYSL